METIKEQYERLRPIIHDGDIVLFSGKAIASRIIKWCDRPADFSHIEIVTKTKEGRLLVQGANMNGVHPEYFSNRLQFHTNFLIIRPLASILSIDCALKIVFSKLDESLIRYDFSNGIKELFNRYIDRTSIKIGTHTLLGSILSNLHLKIKGNKELVCSTFVAPYAIYLGLVNEKFKELRFPFPQDYIRYIDNSKISFIK